MPRFFNALNVTLLPLLAGFSVAGAAVIYSSIDGRQLSVGDRLHLSVTVMAPKGAAVIPPDPASGFGEVAVKEWNSRKFPQSKADSLVFDYSVTTYKAENCTIPALPYVVEQADKRDTLRTESLPLVVIPIHLCKSDSLSDSADIAPLKPPQRTGSRPLLWLWITVGAVLLTAGSIVAWCFLRKRRAGPAAPPPKPPYEEALAALAALDAKKYLQKGMIREYVFELSDILKRYIERTFTVNAAEFTTEEMLAWLSISPLDKERRASMEWFFRNTDPVKFAKFLPDQATLDRFGTEARAFLEATKPPERAPSDKNAPAAAAPAQPAEPKGAP